MALTLHRFSQDDVAELLGWVPDEAMLVQWAGVNFTWPLDDAQMEAYLAGSAGVAGSDGAQPVRAIFRAADESGTTVGHCCLERLNARHRTATLSRILIAPSARGRGLCLPMVEAALAEGFERFDLYRIDLSVFDFNAAAIACYTKAGLRKEGVLRASARVGEERWNAVVMSVLRPEWEARR